MTSQYVTVSIKVYLDVLSRECLSDIFLALLIYLFIIYFSLSLYLNTGVHSVTFVGHGVVSM